MSSPVAFVETREDGDDDVACCCSESSKDGEGFSAYFIDDDEANSNGNKLQDVEDSRQDQ